MKILQCDYCHAEVNNFSHWYGVVHPRNMYELNCVHEVSDDTYNGMIICHECLKRLSQAGMHEAIMPDFDSALHVLKDLKAYCDERDNCVGCPYRTKPDPGRIFGGCLISGTPDCWTLDEVGGEKHGLSDANSTEDQ